MLRFLLPLLFFVSCYPFDEDYDSTVETADLREPVIIEEEPPFFKFDSPTGVEIVFAGSAKTINATGLTLLTTSRKVALDCPTGEVDFSSSGTEPQTVITFTLNDDDTVSDLSVLRAHFSAGAPRFEFGRTQAGCSSVASVVEITLRTDEQLAGTIRAEFFYTETDRPPLGDCSNLISLGVRTIEFVIPLTAC